MAEKNGKRDDGNTDTGVGSGIGSNAATGLRTAAVMGSDSNTTRNQGDAHAVTITRVFGVPARILYRAHAAPEHLVRWFGPAGYPLGLCELDFRVGGKYRFAMKNPSGELMTPFGGQYLALEQDRLIQYTNRMEQPGAELMTVTVTFEENAGKSTLVHHTQFATETMKRAHLGMGYERGVGSGLEQLAHLATELA